ncbi:MAG: hypothetical protein WBY94_01365 [Polyangiaceae bacterium]
MIRFVRWTGMVVVGALDASAMAALFGASSRSVAPAAGASAHAALCFVSTWTIFAGGPPWEGGRRLRALVYLTAFFVPVLGGFGMLAALSVAFARRPSDAPTWTTVPTHGGRVRGRPPARPSLGRIAGILRTRATETNTARFHAVLQVPRFSARESVRILRSCLADPFDEVRLYAFARLERLRDEIESGTRRLTQSLQGIGREKRYRAHLCIAESHWEACYLGLAEGAVFEDSLESARRHASEALRLSPGCGAARFLLGRIDLRSGDYPAATAHLQRALQAGFPAVRVLPYLAEALFAGRHYVSVKKVLRDLARLPGGRGLPRGVLEFWR